MSSSGTRQGCASWSRDRAEPLLGTASRVSRWILVEQPGAWGEDALTQSGLPADVAAFLLSRARDVRARPLLIRRSAGRVGGISRTCLVVSSTQRRTQRVHFNDPRELLDLDLAPLARDEPIIGAERVEAPVYLTCTNGRHDACCAQFGRAVAAEIDRVDPAAAWECSHVGGDRFAANVVCLPDGVYYGRVEPHEVQRLLARHARGLLTLDRYRGRSVHPFGVQAAETLARQHLGLDRLDALSVASWNAPEPERLDVLLAASGQHFVVNLAIRREPQQRQLTCGGSRGRPPVYDLQDVRRVAAPRAG